MGNTDEDSDDIIGNNNSYNATRYFRIYSDTSSNSDKENSEQNPITIGRKRTRDPTKWKRNEENYKRLLGKEYKNRGGRIITAKTFVDIPCNCRRKCNENISSAVRQKNMENFYKLGDQEKQNIYIHGLIKNSAVKRRRAKDNSGNPRSCSKTFYIKNGKEDIRVCKIYFKDTYQIGDYRIHRCSSTSCISSLKDRRGQNIPGNKIDDSNVIKHIRSFPAFSSHYTRTYNPRRQYLNPDLTIKKMYELFIAYCNVEKIPTVKEKFYYNIFSTKFNLHFKPPAKDTCQLCDSLQIKIQDVQNAEKQAAEIEKDIHLDNAEIARLNMGMDQRNVSDEIYVFTFDLEKALSFPKLSTSVAYYKRNLYVYNLGCHAFNNNVICMYVWPETEGSRGSQEIASCLIKHIKTYASLHKQIIMYSDTCTGQNRNIKTSLSLLKLVQSNEIMAESIEQKFLLSGHSYLPNDSDFAIIESSAKKHQHIFCPNDWYEIIKKCKKKTPFFNVVEMNHKDFKSTKPLEEAITRRKKTDTGISVNWLKIKWIKVERSKPHTIQFKYSFNKTQEFFSMNIKKLGAGRPANLINIEQPLLYPSARSITKEKRKDMMDLLKFIPPIKHAYYNNLRSTTRDGSMADATDCDDIQYLDLM